MRGVPVGAHPAGDDPVGHQDCHLEEDGRHGHDNEKAHPDTHADEPGQRLDRGDRQVRHPVMASAVTAIQAAPTATSSPASACAVVTTTTAVRSAKTIARPPNVAAVVAGIAARPT